MLDTPIEYLKGVGPARGELLTKELGIRLFADLLLHYPFRYEDRTQFHRISDMTESSTYVQLRGVIRELGVTGQRQAKRLVAVFADQTGMIELVWFRGQAWMLEKLQVGVEYIVYGRVSSYNGRYNIAHPEVDPCTPAALSRLSALQPVYNTTEKLRNRFLDSDGLRRLTTTLTESLRPEHVRENLGAPVLKEFGLIGRYEALRWIHFPASDDELQKARFRLKFEELFYVQLRLLRLKGVRQATVPGFVFSRVGDAFNTFFGERLPFALTEAQKRVLREIRADLGSGRQMSRLLQGDVGSGKTMVALMTMLLAIDNGFQACLMAPTEILAQQHHATFVEMLGPMNVNVALLTGTTKGKERKKLHGALRDGTLQLLIGTHALIEDEVQFARLGLVVIDEQHRFGVAQRARLIAKSQSPPHLLIMTATPIPRTLAMTLYGDLETSVIDELPPGRKPIKTAHYTETKRLRLFGFMKEQIALGRQVYVVYPLIRESEKLDFQNLQQGYGHIVREFPPPQYQVSIVHGQLSNEQKEFEMRRFINNETQIMVATTVIEVGVNIPNASVMVIESAERFGLSQLHQLRGRVGRGAEQSFCILMTGQKLGADTRLRMETMVRTSDGFEIAEVDLRLRGPGDLEGTRQSGVVDLRLSDLARDGQILQTARLAAAKIIEEDVDLELDKHSIYRLELLHQQKGKPDWSQVG